MWKFNHKLIHHRPNVVSKFTTRLTESDINLINTKFKLWISDDLSKELVNHRQAVKNARIRIYECFKALLQSGMRIGELVSINFHNDPKSRIISNRWDKTQQMVEIIINTEKTCKKREVYIPLESYQFFLEDNRKLTKDLISAGFRAFKRWANLPFKFTAHVCRRTLATLMHEMGVDVNTIAMVLGNTPRVVMEHYIISSGKNYDACEIAFAKLNGLVFKTNNMFVNKQWMRINA